MGALDAQRLGAAATALSETAPHPMENVLLEFVSLLFKISKRLSPTEAVIFHNSI